ncbi:hypothetical protein [Pedobacter agri]|uniref:hypothetical protein n=1 Tax=Pedobacter agri TaxID=454586 RepID=UPI00292FCBCC|nr:hypothetical protein [Pedobacter agri]
MDFNFKDNQKFLNLLKSKEKEILEKTSDNIQDSDGFKIVFAGLKSMLKNNDFHGSKLICIAEDDILAVQIEEISAFDDLFANKDFTYHHRVVLDRELKFLEGERVKLPEDSNYARKTFSELSAQGNMVVFLLLKGKINYFIKGKDKSESLFFSLADVNNYNKKKEISEINEVLAQYQEQLKDRKNYCKFFIELSHLKSLHVDLKSTQELYDFTTENKDVLRNKPEDTFRDDLREFLKFNLRISQIKEYLLENMQRLDIYIYDDFGEVYLIEVKWVGRSIHRNGKKIGTAFGEKDINPDAFKQTLNYLDLLAQKGQNIVRAYLVVFDARKDDLQDTGSNLNHQILSLVEKRQLRKFEKMKDLRVRNIHPS